MRRRLFTFLSALSLLLCVGTCVMWVRSGRHAEVVTFAGSDRWRAVSVGGGVMLDRFRVTRRSGPWNKPYASTAEPLVRYSEVLIEYGAWKCNPPQGEYGTWERDPAQGLQPRWERQDRPATFARSLIRPRVARPALPAVERVSFLAVTAWYNDSHTMEELWFTGRRVWVPYWLAAATTAVLPLLWARIATARLRRARRSRRNHCPSCGYDLRATPGRCPECGKVPAPKLPDSSDRADRRIIPRRGYRDAPG
jgi:hypothetical protein